MRFRVEINYILLEVFVQGEKLVRPFNLGTDVAAVKNVVFKNG